MKTHSDILVPEGWTPISLEFELPDPKLFWNRRAHRMELARLKAESRRLGWMVAERTFRDLVMPETYVWRAYRIEPWYPNNRRRDDDNLVGACKGILDGIFNDFLQQDDSFVRNLGVERTVEKNTKPRMYIKLYFEEL